MMENTHYWHIQSAATRRKQISLRIWYWVSGLVTILSFSFVMLFTLMPSILVVIEWAGKAVPELLNDGLFFYLSFFGELLHSLIIFQINLWV